MIQRTAASPKSKGLIFASFLALACVAISGFALERASAYTQTITDIEDPTVTAKVLDLEVQAESSDYYENTCNFSGCPSPIVLSTFTSHHSLAGSTGDELTEEQFPKVIVDDYNPGVIKITGELVTDNAEGSDVFEDFEHCQGRRTTTKSPRLTVTLNRFYQAGSSPFSGLAGMSLATQNLDPWTQTCYPMAMEGESKATKIESFPAAGPVGVATTDEGCVPEYCDFTISGEGGYTSGVDNASFTLKLRLEYPVAEEEELKAPETTITRSPRKLIRIRSGRAKAVFGFESTGPHGTKFRCRLDRGAFKPCASTFKRKVGKGRHRFAVVSVFGGKTDPTPAVYRWKVAKTG